jgi:acetyl-CoA synthetase
VAQAGDNFVMRAKRSSLRVLGSVGEPINPEIWRWYHSIVGEGKCDIVDTWWQTETGGIMMSSLAGRTPMKPGAAAFPLPGIVPLLLEPEKGTPLEGNGVSGALCMAAPWPGQARTIWGDHERFKQTYFSQYSGLYFTGDGCTRDEDGYYWVTGRIDDVLNVSGHRLGTAEVESALVAHEAVAEAAVVGYPHPIKGQGIYAYVVLAADQQAGEDLDGELKQAVRQAIGGFAAPDVLHVTRGLPKTRSGKIMRRILRKIAAGEFEGLGDLTTLAEPEVVDTLIAQAKQK